MKKLIILTLAVLMVVMTSLPASADYYDEATEPSAIAIITDVALARPGGLMACAIGTSIFLIALPFTVLTDSMDVAGEKLVGDPLRFTFKRPLGVSRIPFAE